MELGNAKRLEIKKNQNIGEKKVENYQTSYIKSGSVVKILQLNDKLYKQTESD